MPKPRHYVTQVGRHNWAVHDRKNPNKTIQYPTRHQARAACRSFNLARQKELEDERQSSGAATK